MTKADLIERVAGRIALSKQHAAETINGFFAQISQALQREENVELRDFGSFRVRKRPALQRRHLRTGQMLEVAAKRLPYFETGKALRELIDSRPKSDHTTLAHTSCGHPSLTGFSADITVPISCGLI